MTHIQREEIQVGLTDDGTNLAGRCRDTVRRGPVPRGETLPGHDECSRVRTEVEKELRQNVDS